VPQELREEWLAKDPIKRFEAYLQEQGILTERQKAEIDARIKAVLDDAVSFAEQAPAPDEATVADYVFAPAGPIAIIGEPGADDPRNINALDTRIHQPFQTVSKAEEALGRR
jgi:hypothetical protein